jgi:hypothetical protein
MSETPKLTFGENKDGNETTDIQWIEASVTAIAAELSHYAVELKDSTGDDPKVTPVQHISNLQNTQNQ